MSGTALAGIALLACALSEGAMAATAERTTTILGTVVDDSSGAACPFANLIVGRTKMGTQTDKNGRFAIRDVPSGIRHLIVVAIGYCRQSSIVRLAPGETLNVELRPRRVKPSRWDGGGFVPGGCDETMARIEPLASPDGKPWIMGTVVDRTTGRRVSSPHLTISGAYVNAGEGWFAAPVDTTFAELRVWAIGYEETSRRLEMRACCVDTTHFRLIPVAVKEGTSR